MSRGPWVTPAFKAEVWRRWQAGESCSSIAQALGKHCAPARSGVRSGIVCVDGGADRVMRASRMAS